MRVRFYVTVPPWMTTEDLKRGALTAFSSPMPADLPHGTRAFTFEVSLPIPDPPAAIEMPVGPVTEIPSGA